MKLNNNFWRNFETQGFVWSLRFSREYGNLNIFSGLQKMSKWRLGLLEKGKTERFFIWIIDEIDICQLINFI